MTTPRGTIPLPSSSTRSTIDLTVDAGRRRRMTRARHIVHVSQPVEAGVAKVVLEQAILQQSQGFEVSVVSPEGWLADQVTAHGLRHLRWDAGREPGRAVADEARRLDAQLAGLRPSLVHLHSSKAGLAGRLSIRGRIPTIFQPHAWSFQASSARVRAAALHWERWAARWTDLTLCCSEAERRLGLSAGIKGISLSVGNGVDLAEFRPPSFVDREQARRRLAIPAETPIAVCVGRLQPQKGQQSLVASWASVRARVPGAQLLLIGAGPDEEQLRAAAGDGVRFIGQVTRPRDYFLAADVCVLPSQWEGLSLALLEGMACARSTVATDVSGSRELLLGEDPAGAVVGLGSPAELAAAVVERLSSPRLAASEGAAARRRIEQSFTTESVAKRFNVGYNLVWRLRERKQVQLPEPISLDDRPPSPL